LTTPFVVLFLFLTSAAEVAAEPQTPAAAVESGEDPDVPRFLGNIDKETFLRLRDQEIWSLRGFDDAKRLPYNPRQRAIEFFERQRKINVLANQVTWTEIGPRPIPNGQTQSVTNPVTGRATALAIDPTNNSRIYLGTAFGGVWRSLDGGTNWTPIFDTAQSLAIGALALAPSDPTILTSAPARRTARSTASRASASTGSTTLPRPLRSSGPSTRSATTSLATV
jgi:hypothetical protein